MEIELKLLIHPDDAPALRRHPLLRAAKPVVRRLLSVYFDTPDLFLRRRAVALRVRRVAGRWVQTVKSEGTVQGGLHQRPEWEAAVAKGEPDLSRVADPDLRATLSKAEARGLQPAFTTAFRRTAWMLSFAGSQIELSLDQGEVSADAGSLPISEIELELKQGEPASLYELALRLQEEIPLRLENQSKAERGYLLRAPARVEGLRAPAAGLSAEMDAGHAFQAVARNCIAHLEGNLGGVREDGDPESAHQARVALRRLRSALGLFAGAAPAIRDAALLEELRWLAGEIGPARDWDVFLAETLPPLLAQCGESSGLQALARDMAGARVRAYGSARLAADSQRTQRLLLRLGAWLWREPWRVGGGDGPNQPVMAFAARVLGRRHRQVRRLGKNLAALGTPERHRLRIAAKKLRYAAEFFAGLYPHKRSQSYLKTLAALQDVLGRLNDQATTARLLGEVKGTRPTAARMEAIGLVQGWTACRTEQELLALEQVWTAFARRRAFWSEAEG
jgi:triphosphatase